MPGISQGFLLRTHQAVTASAYWGNVVSTLQDLHEGRLDHERLQESHTFFAESFASCQPDTGSVIRQTERLLARRTYAIFSSEVTGAICSDFEPAIR